jgi:GNAT superfamily N-acetyltransferase
MITTTSDIQFYYYKPSMYPAFKALMQHCFADMGGEFACEKEMTLLSNLYSRGQIVAFVEGKMVGGVISRIVPFESYNRAHTQAQILDLSTYVSDAEEGNALYGLDIFVHADYRRLKLGNALYIKLIEQYESDNFTDFLGASRVSNYANYAKRMSLRTYIEQVKNGEIKDGALSFHLHNGMEIFDVMYDFNEGDTMSSGCGVAMGVANAKYNPNLPTYKERKIRSKKFMAQAA